MELRSVEPRKSKKLIDAWVQTCESVQRRERTPERMGEGEAPAATPPVREAEPVKVAPKPAAPAPAGEGG